MILRILTYALIGMLSVQCQTKKNKETTPSATPAPDTTGGDSAPIETPKEQTDAIQKAADEYTKSQTCENNPTLESCQAADEIKKPENTDKIQDVVKNINKDDVNTVQDAVAPSEYSSFQRWGGLTLLIVGVVGAVSAGGYAAWRLTKKSGLKQLKPELDPDAIAEGIRQWNTSRVPRLSEGVLKTQIEAVSGIAEELRSPSADKTQINDDLIRRLGAGDYATYEAKSHFYEVLYAYSMVSGDDAIINELQKTINHNSGTGGLGVGVEETITRMGTGDTNLQSIRNTFNADEAKLAFMSEYKNFRQPTLSEMPKGPKSKKLISGKTKGVLAIVTALLFGGAAVGGGVAFGTSFSLADNSESDAARFMNRLNQIMDAILASR